MRQAPGGRGWHGSVVQALMTRLAGELAGSKALLQADSGLGWRVEVAEIAPRLPAPPTALVETLQCSAAVVSVTPRRPSFCMISSASAQPMARSPTAFH